jgi:hypothetical protein
MLKKSFWIILLLVFVSFNNCTFQKRLYRKGYYVDWLSKKKEINKQNKESINDDEIPVKSVYSLSKVKFDENIIVENTGKKTISKNIVLLSKNLNDSCDKLIMRNGDEQLVKVIEISDREIKYKRCDFLNGPTYTISKNKVYLIEYANGIKEHVVTYPEDESNSQKAEEENNYKYNGPKKYPGEYWTAWILFAIGIIYLGLITWPIALFFARSAKRKAQKNPRMYKGAEEMGCLAYVLLGFLAVVFLGLLFIGLLLLQSGPGLDAMGILFLVLSLIPAGIIYFYLLTDKEEPNKKIRN